MASVRVVVVDADVLIPILPCDFLLTGLDVAVFELVVTPKLLDEMERHLVTDFAAQDHDRLALRAERVRIALRNYVHEDLPPTAVVEAVNAKDRHVAMAGGHLAGNRRRNQRPTPQASARRSSPEGISDERRSVRSRSSQPRSVRRRSNPEQHGGEAETTADDHR